MKMIRENQCTIARSLGSRPHFTAHSGYGGSDDLALSDSPSTIASLLSVLRREWRRSASSGSGGGAWGGGGARGENRWIGRVVGVTGDACPSVDVEDGVSEYARLSRGDAA